MTKKLLTLAATSLLFLQIASAQLYLDKLKLDVGLNLGGTVLVHNTNFEDGMGDLYRYDKLILAKNGVDYTWDKFESDHQLRSSFAQPRIGFSALVTYGKLPFFLMAEYMSSNSSYQKMSISGTIGMGQDFYLPSEVDFFGIKGGYKFVIRDFGYGASTLVNSIGDEEIREAAAAFYDPKQPLGSPTGRLFATQLGYGHVFGESHDFIAGVDLFGELDLTPQISRTSRMTNFGIQAYFRFRLMGRSKVWNDEIFLPRGSRY